ncbi:phosphatase PAP2 family protein [Amycolatopsis pithecellobii]|uniref:Phosphatase PAP2 family protein n=1 Tax=Amycolatopsis pithecellobii TaxID=664692 RepID=A0A6N7ZA43_9PSEU|nr:phosphatase PAP2 family protein [Amycolatopsis pithecellobii]MTD58602.1 phosphatase PAP2 family protein [Amycolatopsis pithecellobii]
MTETSAPPALPSVLRVPLSVVTLAAALVVLVQALTYAGDSGGEWVAPMDGLPGPLRDIALAIDFLGEPTGSVLVLVVCTGGCWLAGRRRSAVLVLVAAGVTVGATTLLKPLVDRTIHGGYLSFPSGHTAFATALALVLTMVAVDRLQLRAAAGTALVLAVALLAGAVMGWTEVALSAHYPTDTLGGFCTALAIVPPVALAVDRFLPARLL